MTREILDTLKFRVDEARRTVECVRTDDSRSPEELYEAVMALDRARDEYNRTLIDAVPPDGEDLGEVVSSHLAGFGG
jgi:hypothetical protein